MGARKFIFSSYECKPHTGDIFLRYALDGITFEERVTIPPGYIRLESVNREELDRALFALHLIGGISYWKAYCPREIEVRSGSLTPHQAEFWNTLYTKGLGEFFYKNKIDFRGLVRFPSSPAVALAKAGKPTGATNKIAPRELRPLVPIGGGKDSIVTLELLKQHGMQPVLFTVVEAAPIRAVAKVAGGKYIRVSRHLDKQLAELNHSGAYNGHVPISAYWSFVALVTALLTGTRECIFSWERSASEGNITYLGMEVNHQFSKSLEYERMLQAYIAYSITKRVRIFSLIRPLSELHVVKLFTKYHAYFPHFSSCNKNFSRSAIKEGRGVFWCAECPKCAFMCVMLSAWLPYREVITIIGVDMFSNQALIPLFEELLGISSHKPFACVGEAKEVAAAFELAFRRGEANHTPALSLYADRIRPHLENMDVIIREYLTPSFQHLVPSDYENIVSRYGNSKIQIPNTKQISISNDQNV